MKIPRRGRVEAQHLQWAAAGLASGIVVGLGVEALPDVAVADASKSRLRQGVEVLLIILAGCFGYWGGQRSNREPSQLAEASSLAQQLVVAALMPGVVDHHAHVFAYSAPSLSRWLTNNGCASSGTWERCEIGERSESCPYVQPARLALRPRPGLWARTRVVRSAAHIDSWEHADEQALTRLEALLASPTMSTMILAFDAYRSGAGAIDWNRTDLYIPNDVVIDIAACLDASTDSRIVAVASIHPARPDWREELERVYARGIRHLKWLPNVMNIDPAHDYDAFYEAIAALDMVLMSHTGAEHATEVVDEARQRYGDPLRMQRALDAGVTVVLAHSGGDDIASLPPGDNAHERFVRMMQDPRAEEDWCLFGDLSAVTLDKNIGHFLTFFADIESWRYRLVYGSDYPLPGAWILAIPSLRALRRAGMITRDESDALRELLRHDPLLFDLVTKRTLHNPGNPEERLPREMFLSLPRNARLGDRCTGRLLDLD